MKEISKSVLEKLSSSYKSKPVLNVLETVLYKNELSSIILKPKIEENTHPVFSIEIPTMGTTNQKQSGRCWLFAGLNFLREKIAKNYNLTDLPTKRKNSASFELSQNYLGFYDKLEKINFFLESIDDFLDADKDDRTFQHILKTGIQDGGQWDMFVALVKKYGVVPKSVMPETANSSSTRFVNGVINTRLRLYVADARKNKSNIKQLKEAVLEELYNLLSITYGKPPVEFDFEYLDKKDEIHIVNNLTPIKFFNDNIKNIDDYISIINSPTDDKPFYQSYVVSYLGNVVNYPIKYLNLPISELKELALKQLKDQEIVWFGSDVSRFGDRTFGTWDENIFAIEEITKVNQTLTKADQLDYSNSSMNHAMILSGVHFKGKDTIVKWKIENSWGDQVGDKGYFICSDSWFDNFVYQAVINKKHLSEKQLDAFNKTKPIILKPWDPMGSLAE